MVTFLVRCLFGVKLVVFYLYSSYAISDSLNGWTNPPVFHIHTFYEGCLPRWVGCSSTVCHSWSFNCVMLQAVCSVRSDPYPKVYQNVPVLLLPCNLYLTRILAELSQHQSWKYQINSLVIFLSWICNIMRLNWTTQIPIPITIATLYYPWLVR